MPKTRAPISERSSDLYFSNSSAAFLVLPEDRLHSIRMCSDLPVRWIEKGLKSIFRGVADKGENFAFQLGIYALKDLKNVQG